jgi:ATP-dependent exoDNAse (exonuclease V) alpha subunit
MENCSVNHTSTCCTAFMAAARKACVSNGRPPLIAPAIDLIEGRSLSLAERFAVVTKSGEKKDGGEERAGLTKGVELMIGMPVMVTTNIQTELDIANGSRGEIVGIVLHPSEKDWKEEDCIRNLTQQPPYILVKLLRTKIQQLSDLPHVIPIFPITKSFTISVGGSKQTVTRTQFPITSAYAFTDYRAEGQTIAPAIVDIGRPPTGGLTPFNIYVALSRARGREGIRLLRDFDEQLLQQHPNQFLRVEDDRLKKLDDETKNWWEIVTTSRIFRQETIDGK